LILSLTNYYYYFETYLFPDNHQIISDQVLDSTQNLGVPDSRISTLSGRTFIWEKAWGLFLTSPVVGRGFHADRIFLNGLHAHNTWVHVMIQSGAIGLILFLLAVIISFMYLLNRLNRFPKDLVLLSCFGLFIFFLIRSAAESFAFFGADWLFFTPVILYIQQSVGNDKNIKILGQKIDVLDKSDVFKKMSYWIKNEKEKSHWIVVCGMHGVVEGYKDKNFMDMINSADLSLIDGSSLVFLGRLMGFKIEKRIAGPDLMKDSMRFSQSNGYSVFFLGDTEDTLDKLVEKSLQSYPNLNIAGKYSPSFKDFSNEYDEKIIEIINQKKPDILWVAFSLAKQEKWIYKNRNKINVPIVVGVGAAFKFLSGKVKRAPKWIGDAGFEWLWRLFCEPKRIWKRVFIFGPIFFWLIIKDFLGLKKK